MMKILNFFENLINVNKKELQRFNIILKISADFVHIHDFTLWLQKFKTKHSIDFHKLIIEYNNNGKKNNFKI